MARPSSRKELIDYCLRALGAPVIQINVDDDQLEDRMDEALQFYQEYHSDGVVKTFVKHRVTQEDMDNNYITVPDDLLCVFRVLNINSGDAADMFGVKYQMFLNDLYGLRNPESLVNYEMTKQYLGLIEMTLTGMSQQIVFTRHMDRLVIADDWQKSIKLGQYIVIEGYQTINPIDYPQVYNDMMLKRYLTALIKRQFGTNLGKFSNVSLPGGVTMNGLEIYAAAIEEIAKIEETFMDRYSMPPDFYCG